MRDTAVFVSAHTSNLANAVLLQPGSAVVEIIQVTLPAVGVSAVHVDE
jgi:capsular polysaccharide biosynthesis protein